MDRKRQARGELRIAGILDAAATTFAEAGYEKTTTNAIAAAAGISPGSLYQFFPNKEAVARALADRFVTQMGDAHAAAFARIDPAAIPLADLVDRVIDPLLAFNVANPGFKALFARADMPAGLTEAAAPIQAALLGRVTGILRARSPHWATLEPAEPERAAQTLINVVKGMLPAVVAAPAADRAGEIRELKLVLCAYLGHLEG